MFTFLPFAAVSVANCIATAQKRKVLENWTKPFLMPTLLLAYLLTAKVPAPLVILGLICGFCGDVLLQFPGQKALMAGIAAFLLGHVLYGIQFVLGCLTPTLWMGIVLILCAAFYAVVGLRLLATLKGSLGDMRVPATAYLAVITAMAYVALAFALTSARPLAWCAALGGIFFLVSDTVLAHSIFRGNMKHGGAIIMPTYLVAQFLIVLSQLA